MATKTYNIDINVQSKTLGQLEDQLSQVNEELKQVDRNSEAFKNLTKQAQVLNKEINKTNKEIEGFTMERQLEAADGAAKIFSGTLNTVVGSLGVLGVESEKFGEFEKKAASAIAAGLGVKDLVEGIGKVGPAFAKAGSSALKFAKTTKGALIATGVGAFAVIVGTLIANWDGVTKAVENFAKKVPIVGTVIEKIKEGINGLIDVFRPVLEWLGILPDEAERANNAVIESNEKLLETGERELALLQARGASAEEIFAQREKMLQAELDNLKRTEADKEEIYKKETELLALQEAEKTRILNEAEAKRKEGRDKAAEKKKADDEKAKADEEARLQALADLELEYYEKQRDFEAKTREEQILLEQERALEDLERLGGTLEQRNQLIAYYNQLLKENAEEEDQKARDKKKADDEKQFEEEKALEEKKLNLKLNSLQTLSELFGQETALGKAALVAKQVLLAKELINEAKGITFKAQNAATEATIDGAKAQAAIAGGAAETAKVGFPWNIPLLIAYAAQAVGIVRSIKEATSNVAAATGTGVGLNITNTNIPTPPVEQAQAPITDPVAQPAIRAYVVQGDTRSAAEAEAKIQTRRTFGS